MPVTVIVGKAMTVPVIISVVRGKQSAGAAARQVLKGAGFAALIVAGCAMVIARRAARRPSAGEEPR